MKLETETEVKYSGNYQAIYRQLDVVYEKIGASDFYAVVGEKFDVRRHQRVRGSFACCVHFFVQRYEKKHTEYMS